MERRKDFLLNTQELVLLMTLKEFLLFSMSCWAQSLMKRPFMMPCQRSCWRTPRRATQSCLFFHYTGVNERFNTGCLPSFNQPLGVTERLDMVQISRRADPGVFVANRAIIPQRGQLTVRAAHFGPAEDLQTYIIILLLLYLFINYYFYFIIIIIFYLFIYLFYFIFFFFWGGGLQAVQNASNNMQMQNVVFQNRKSPRVKRKNKLCL